MPQFSSTLPTFAKLRVKGLATAFKKKFQAVRHIPDSSGRSSAGNAGGNVEAVPQSDTPSLLDLMNGLAGLAPMPTRENEGMETGFSNEFRVLLLSVQAETAESKFQRFELVKDLDEVIEYRRQILALTPDGHQGKPSRFAALGLSLLSRYMRVGDIADLNKAAENLDQGNRLAPDWHIDKPAILDNLGIIEVSRFEHFGELENLENGIDYQTQALLLTPDGHGYKPSLLNNLGISYESRFERLGELGDLDKAIEYQVQAVLLTPDGHADKLSRLNNLGVSYQSRFERLGELADLNRAVEFKTQAVLLTPNGHPCKPDWISNLGIAYASRFGCLGELADLSRAVDYHTQAVLLTPDGHAHKPGFLNNLGVTLESRFERLGELADLHGAIKYKTEAAQLIPEGHGSKPRWLHNLGNSYQARFERLGELADLNKAIDYYTQAVLLTPDGHADKPTLLGGLGGSYESRFMRLGAIEDVNKAIEYKIQALLLTPDGHASKPVRLNNLGNSYESRFSRLGEPVDLDRAIELQSQAVLLTPEGHADRPNRLTNLGISYKSRFRQLGNLSDLNKAVECLTQAMLLIPDGHSAKTTVLSSLGGAYVSRFARLGELADATKAIEYRTQAVLLTPDGHAGKPTLIDDLGNAYGTRFTRLGELADLQRTIEYLTQAVLLTPDGHTNKPRMLLNLGTSYDSRFKRLGDLSDLESAQSTFQRGAELIVTDPQGQSQCAREWARCSLLLGRSPKLAYERAMELIPQLVWLGTPIRKRFSSLRAISDLATEAAAWAISVDAYELALEWLEEGRSIVWNQILQLRTPFDDLSVVNPALARQLKDVAFELEGAGSRPSESASSMYQSFDLEKVAQQHYQLATEWQRLLRQARSIPGFQSFLRPRQASELKLAASDGPVVVLNAHSSRCDALVIFPECEDVAHLPLPNLSLAKLEQTRVQLQAFVGHRGHRVGGFKRLNPITKPENMLQSILTTLWSEVVQPVLDLIACSSEGSPDELPHVTWCTTGALSFLPLHAAGCYDGSQPNACDLIISSYTPTLNTLLTPNTSATGLSSGILAVGQEHTRGFCSLPNTVHELAVIGEHAKVTRYQQLDGSSATADAVLAAMEKNSWVHLACHATQNPDDPTRSAFHLHDGALTLEAITQRSFKNKGLAFLSACQTATGDERLADEAVHLAAGMLMAGYPSVIATMWSIQDEDGPKIAEAVYADLLKDGKMDHRQAARALHKAVAGLRETVGVEEFRRWVPFIHIGV